MTAQPLNSMTKHTTAHSRRPVLLSLQATFKQWRARRSQRNAYLSLLEQPDYLLQDIGLNRQDIKHQINRLSAIKWQ